MDETIQRILFIQEQISAELKEIKEELKEIRIIDAQQQKDIEYHIQRTNLLEKQTESVVESLKPMQKHISHVEGGLKFLGLLSLLCGLTVGVVQVIKFFN